ncbi:MAG: hypothetical protein KAS94_02115 [Desulfobulbaceae bacterium]|nr:hypothetical protein [Desulfobulbaceae bacterium]
MKQYLYIILASLLLSGCATKGVTRMGEGDTFRLFHPSRVSQAYFNPTNNDLVVALDIFNGRDNQRKQKCFTVDITESLTKGVEAEDPVFSTDRLTVCPGNDSGPYELIPVTNLSSRSGLTTVKPSSWILDYDASQPDELVLMSLGKEDKFIPVQIPAIRKRKPSAYLLYPFSIIADIVTAPYQLFLYIYLTNAMSV